MSARDLASEISDGAVFARDAHFTLSIEKARQKLEKFQLPNPRHYILQIVQAIAASGASRLDVESERNALSHRLTLTFDGPGYTGAELRRLYDYLFESGRSRQKDRTREMALGLLSCQALSPLWIRLSSHEHTWEKKGKAGEQVVARSDGRTRNVFEVISRTEPTELDLLSSHCHDCSMIIVVNGSEVTNRRMTRGLECPWPNFRFCYNFETRTLVHEDSKVDDDCCFGAFGISYGDLKHTTLTLLRYGVQFSRRYESRIRPPLIMVCEHPGLRKNVSQSDVVEDAAYLKFLEMVNSVQMAFSARLAEQRIPSYHSELVQRYLIEYFQGWFTPDMVRANLDSLDEQTLSYLKVPLFTEVRGRRHSIYDLILEYRRYGQILYCESNHFKARHLSEGPRAVVVDERSLQLLRRIFDRCVCADSDLEGMIQRAVAEAEWQKTVAVLPQVLVNHTFDQEGCEHPVQLMLPNRYPDGKASLYVGKGSGLYQHTEISRGRLTFALVTDVPLAPAVVEKLLAEHLPLLYARALGRIKTCVLSDKTRDPARRCIEHVLSNWLELLDAAGDRRKPAVVLGKEAWGQGIFLDRSERWVSLADVDYWLKTFAHVVLCRGGLELEGDYGLSASSLSIELLRRVFGKERLLVTTVDSQLIAERQQQAPLAGSAAEKRVLVAPVEVTEEQELAEIRREYEEAGHTAVVTRSEPAVEFEATEVEGPTAALERLLADSPCLVQHHFEHPGLRGTLLVPDRLRPGTHRQGTLQPGELLLFEPDGKSFSRSSREVPLTGWLQVLLDDPEPKGILERKTLVDLDPARQALLFREVDLFFEKVVAEIHHYPSGTLSYLHLFGLLVAYLTWWERPALDNASPIRNVPWIVGTLGEHISLQELRNRAVANGAFLWCTPQEYEENIPVVRSPLDSERLVRWVGYPGRRVDAAPLVSEPNLLDHIRDQLWALPNRHRFLLTDELIQAISWGEPSSWLSLRRPYFVIHHSGTGTTELNPNHALIRKIAKQLARPDASPGPRLASMLMVLASSVYTAINRALREVEDQHELVLLETLLDKAMEGGA